MKVKKVIALLLAVTAVLSMVVSASADAGDPPIDESKFSSPVVPVEGESVILNNGLQIRWLNTAGFELILPQSGKHMLIDPWLDESTTEWPFPLDEIDQCDYLILSHIHGDHADSVKRIQDKFGRFPTIVPSDSVRTLCEWQNVDLCSIYRAFPNMTYTWDDVKVDIYQGRHTETNGAYATDAEKLAAGGQSASGWYGQADLYSYLITCADGTKILIWAGMTTEEQKNLFEGVQPDIAVTHLSPKHDLKLYAEMIKAWGPKVVIPHHYDAIPSIFLAWNEEQVAKNTTDYSRPYVDDEIGFNIEGYVNELNSYIQAVAPNAQVLIPNHHQWYKFGFGYYTDISAK